MSDFELNVTKIATTEACGAPRDTCPEKISCVAIFRLGETRLFETLRVDFDEGDSVYDSFRFYRNHSPVKSERIINTRKCFLFPSQLISNEGDSSAFPAALE